MGCASSKPQHSKNTNGTSSRSASTQHRVHSFSKPKWKSQEPLTHAKLEEMREQFWFTEPAYGGDKVIWDALKAVCEQRDMKTARAIIDSAGIIVAAENMTVCYDTTGVKYELPLYVLSAPTNLVKDAKHGPGSVALTAGTAASS